LTTTMHTIRACAIPRSSAAIRALAETLVLSLLGGAVQASPTPALATPKVATDLRLAIEAPTTPRLSWVRNVSGQRWVRVVVTGQKWAAPMAEVKKDVAARGGHVLAGDPNKGTLLATIPASQVGALAARADVLHVAPHRTQAGAPVAAAAATPVPTQAHLAAVGLGPQSARARSDLALAGE